MGYRYGFPTGQLDSVCSCRRAHTRARCYWPHDVQNHLLHVCVPCSPSAILDNGSSATAIALR
jgi:hypothetical protein